MSKTQSPVLPFFNNARTHQPPLHGVPEFSQDLAEVDNGVEVIFIEESADRYKGVPASAYSLEAQIKQGVPLEKTNVYIQLEKTHGSEIAMRTVSKLQERIDARNLAAYKKQINEESERRVNALFSAAASPAASAAASAAPSAGGV